MKKNLRTVIPWALSYLLIVISAVFLRTSVVMAEGYGITMSPMNQSMIINPGDSREASFKISNQYFATTDVAYEISVEPFYVNDGEIVYEANGDSGEIADWVSFNVPTSGKLAPNETEEISFRIDVPESAPGGGQYVSIIVTLDDANIDDSERISEGVSIKEIKRMAHLIYAEITGNTVRKGEIIDANLPSFLFGGNIVGSSIVKNTGNVHSEAKYTLQVYPLFSDEEVYTNEEKPDTKKVLPDRSVYRELVWEDTPGIGIYNVVYTVEFEDAMAQVKKMVIICPIWLLFIILFVILFIIMWLFIRVKSRKRRAN